MTTNTYSSTELQRKTGKVLNDVFTNGSATIEHRDRGVIYMFSASEFIDVIQKVIKESQNATK